MKHSEASSRREWLCLPSHLIIVWKYIFPRIGNVLLCCWWVILCRFPFHYKFLLDRISGDVCGSNFGCLICSGNHNDQLCFQVLCLSLSGALWSCRGLLYFQPLSLCMSLCVFSSSFWVLNYVSPEVLFICFGISCVCPQQVSLYILLYLKKKQ